MGVNVERTINYTVEPPENFQQLLTIYESLGWNSLNLTFCLYNVNETYDSLRLSRFPLKVV